MSQQRDSREAQIYDRVMYPGPEPRVPVNKLGIRDRTKLEAKEAEIVAARMEQGLPSEACEMTYAGFKALHRHLFQDVYEWAGQERTHTTGRNEEVPFARPENIEDWMERQFQVLREANHLQGLERRAFAEKAAELVNEMNAAHPFIEGNGRVQRVWLQLVAERAGHMLEFRGADREPWNEAARVGFLHVDHRPMARLIEACLARTQERSVDATAERSTDGHA